LLATTSGALERPCRGEKKKELAGRGGLRADGRKIRGRPMAGERLARDELVDNLLTDFPLAARDYGTDG